MNKTKLVSIASLAMALVAMMAPDQISIYASPTTEDDGWTEGDYEGTLEEQEEQAREDWEDAGRPGEEDDNNDDNDNDNDNNDNNNEDDGPNPYCDKVGPNYRGTCHDRLDYYQGGPNDGLYPCNDGTNMYDWRDCKDATKKDTSLTNNFNPNNDNNDNSNSDNIPECKRDVLQECKLRGNTGLLCSVEDLMQGDYNPSVIGNGHACHDVYIGTYNQLEACKDGTYAVSCGSIGVLPGIP
jgi:hypothetical protein